MRETVKMDLRIDYAFKQLFGSPGNERLLIDFLNEVLKLPVQKRICQATVVNSEVLKEHELDKKSILDLLVQTNEGVYVNIEIQISNEYDMPVRSLYYASRIYTKQMQQGMAYLELKQTIAINIIDFMQFGSTEAYLTRFELYDKESQVTLTDQLQICFVELPKLLSKWKSGEANPREDRMVRWLLMLEAANHEAILEELEDIAMKEDPVLKEAFEKWDELSQDPNTMFAYEMRRKQVFDEHAKVREAEIRMQRAEAKALAEGTARGMAEGTARGMAEGKAEIIRAMLRNNLKLEQISEITGLSVAEIESLDKTFRDN